MADDARFQDADIAGPLRLMAVSAEDLSVIGALVQDGVVQASDMSFMQRGRRFAMLVNRFRWEDRDNAQAAQRPLERVQSLLFLDSVLGAKTQGIQPGDPDTVLSVLALDFEPSDDAAGVLTVTFAGDGALRLDVECVDVKLKDVSRPYEARAQRVPEHP